MGPMSMPSSAAAAFRIGDESIAESVVGPGPGHELGASGRVEGVMFSIWARISSAEKIPFSTRRLVTAICMT